ncbi:hypothetical protein BDU57DRAFT_523330 [Ampelomyces quisqualis]|uniref:Secreted protein n=1 Tax=Ampelomyces quisqualis TaxID=50730 RepID=A0A6A5QB10_AMPQU|nr:hypothetical protein BDU57DRAFT_523330 [Ampelomyces quisqualis]
MTVMVSPTPMVVVVVVAVWLQLHCTALRCAAGGGAVVRPRVRERRAACRRRL